MGTYLGGSPSLLPVFKYPTSHYQKAKIASASCYPSVPPLFQSSQTIVLSRIGRIGLLRCFRNHIRIALLESRHFTMKSSSEGSTSTTPSPSHQKEDNIFMYPEFAPSKQKSHQTTFQSPAMAQENVYSTPRVGGIRASLACVPVSLFANDNEAILTYSQCRSRHVKCGAEMPNCSRCLQDDKPCFYAKSRRGMRDRNAPRKRTSVKENERSDPISGGHYGLAHNPMTYPMGLPSTDSYSRSSSDPSASPDSSSSRRSGKSPSPTRLLDLYYKYDPKISLLAVFRVSKLSSKF